MPIVFDLPEGFQIPDQTEPGQSFDAVATISVGDDGKSATLGALTACLSKEGEAATESRAGGPTSRARRLRRLTAGAGARAGGDQRSFLQAMGAT